MCRVDKAATIRRQAIHATQIIHEESLPDDVFLFEKLGERLPRNDDTRVARDGVDEPKANAASTSFLVLDGFLGRQYDLSMRDGVLELDRDEAHREVGMRVDHELEGRCARVVAEGG